MSHYNNKCDPPNVNLNIYRFIYMIFAIVSCLGSERMYIYLYISKYTCKYVCTYKYIKYNGEIIC